MGKGAIDATGAPAPPQAAPRAGGPTPLELKAAKSTMSDYTNDAGGELELKANFKAVDVATLPPGLKEKVEGALAGALAQAGKGAAGAVYRVPWPDESGRQFLVVDAINRGGGWQTKSFHEEFHVLNGAGEHVVDGFFNDGMKDPHFR